MKKKTLNLINFSAFLIIMITCIYVMCFSIITMEETATKIDSYTEYNETTMLKLAKFDATVSMMTPILLIYFAFTIIFLGAFGKISEVIKEMIK